MSEWWGAALVIVVMTAATVLGRAIRNPSLRRSAEALGLTSSNVPLPQDLDLQALSCWGRFDSVSNVMSGVFEGLSCVAFDHYSNCGDSSYYQTIVAFRTTTKTVTLNSLWRASELIVETTGQWVSIYRKRELVQGKGLDKFLRESRALLAYLDDPHM